MHSFVGESCCVLRSELPFNDSEVMMGALCLKCWSYRINDSLGIEGLPNRLLYIYNGREKDLGLLTFSGRDSTLYKAKYKFGLSWRFTPQGASQIADLELLT